MPDREKVIKGLAKLKENSGCIAVYDCDCKTCPYDRVNGCCSQVIEDAIALLKAQEPVEPVFERQFMSSIEIYDCGKCGTSLGAKGIAKYCMNCGQAVKWDG